MTFPLIFHPLGVPIHAHTVFESLGYLAGAQLYWRHRRHHPAEDFEKTLWLLVAAAFGAWAGSKILALLESPIHYAAIGPTWQLLVAGKTIVGGILGAWAAIEIAKRPLHITRNTGDAFVIPLSAGVAIGRIGCFLEGLPDHTYGLPSTLPWAVNFGDNIPRHPTQLYESLFAALLAPLVILTLLPTPPGQRFRAWIALYMAFRLAIEFLKPRDFTLAGLSPIQYAAAIGMLIAIWSLYRLRKKAAT